MVMDVGTPLKGIALIVSSSIMLPARDPDHHLRM
jgi:hypothetical protein